MLHGRVDGGGKGPLIICHGQGYYRVIGGPRARFMSEESCRW